MWRRKGAPQVLLDLNLSSNLLLHLALDDLGLVETFEGEDVARRALCADHVHTAKLAFSEWPAHVKVGQVPFARRAIPINPRCVLARAEESTKKRLTRRH